MSHGSSSLKAILYALAANAGIALSKGIAAFITGSGSMLAETIHSLADCSNQLLLLVGMKRAGRMPDTEHPLGYGMVVYFWSFIVAMLLFSVGGLFSIYEGVHKLMNPEPITNAWLALLILAVSIVLESLSTLGSLREIRKLRGRKKLLGWIRSSRSSELIVVLGEDVAAVMGLVTAFVFVLLAWLLDRPALDALGSICIGAILICVSMFLIIRMKSLLIGSSADPEIESFIEKAIAGNGGVEQALRIITLQMGPYIMLAAKIRMKRGLHIDAACGIINGLEADLKKRFPEIRWSFIEPDICD